MGFDKLVHQPTRLRIFAYLYRHGETDFPTIKESLDVTEGNLASHAQKMEDAGAVEVNKQFVDRKPQTTYRLTEDGEAMFEDHIEVLDALIGEISEE